MGYRVEREPLHADIVAQLAAASEKPGAVARNDGDAAGAIAQAAQRIDAVYKQPFLAHATMEPMNCAVQMTTDGCDIWVGTQIPGRTQAAVMKVTGLKREQLGETVVLWYWFLPPMWRPTTNPNVLSNTIVQLSRR